MSCPYAASLHRGDESAEKRSHRNRSSSPVRVRLLQPLLPRPQKRRRPATYSRSQTPALRPDEKVVQDDHFETDPLAIMPRGLVHVAGYERRVLSHPGSPTSQTIIEIRIRRGGISIQGPAVWAVPGSPHFYTMHGCAWGLLHMQPIQFWLKQRDPSAAWRHGRYHLRVTWAVGETSFG